MNEVEKEYQSFSGHPDQHFGCKTFSQHGDDLMILNLFKIIGIEKPSYLDLGAHDPIIISNTALLYLRGSRGVNVEANPNLIERFKRLRPEDVNVNVGVGIEAGTKTFYMYSNTSGRNTFSAEEVKTLDGILMVREKIELPVLSLPQIVEKYCGGKFPDLLSCDIEGMDYDVLSMLPSEVELQPKVVCVETRIHETSKMNDMMLEKKFQPYCRMGENLFFIRDKEYFTFEF